MKNKIPPFQKRGFVYAREPGGITNPAYGTWFQSGPIPRSLLRFLQGEEGCHGESVEGRHTYFCIDTAAR